MLQFAGNHKRRERIFLHKDPWKVLTFIDLPSVSAQAPGMNQGLSMWSLGGLGRRGSPDSSEVGPKRAEAQVERGGGPLGLDYRCLAGPEQRPARGSVAPGHGARWEWLCQRGGGLAGNKRPGKLQWRERKGYGGSIGDSTSWEGSSPCDFKGDPRRRSGLAREGVAQWRIYQRVKVIRKSLWHGHEMGEVRRRRARGGQPMAGDGWRRSARRGLWARGARIEGRKGDGRGVGPAGCVEHCTGLSTWQPDLGVQA
jgi:hypothetical protein